MNLAPLDYRRHAQDLRDTWQARALAETRGKEAAVVLAVLFHNYRPAMQILLRVVFPNAPLTRIGWPEISRPFLVGHATVRPGGIVVCDAVNRDGRRVRAGLLFPSETQLTEMFRKLADRLRLPDEQRVEMMGAVRNWVARDERIDHLGVRRAS